MEKRTAEILIEAGRDADLLNAIADICGKKITIHHRGKDSAGDVVIIDGSRRIINPRLCDDDVQEKGPWVMDYSITDDGRINFAWIGHKLLGPCYQLDYRGEWRNCYSHGNFGDRPASGGVWSSAPGSPEYDTFAKCVAGRQEEITRAIALRPAIPAPFLTYAAMPAEPPKLAAE